LLLKKGDVHAREIVSIHADLVDRRAAVSDDLHGVRRRLARVP